MKRSSAASGARRRAAGRAVARWLFAAIAPQLRCDAIGAPLLINPALTAECIGLKHFGAVFGILTLLNTFGVAVGAVLTGVIYDIAKSYFPAYTLFIILLAIAGLCGIRARREYAA